MKIILYIIAALLLTVVSVVVAFPSVINWNKLYGKLITHELESMYKGAHIKIGGNIEGTFIKPKIIINNLYLKYQDDYSTYDNAIISVGKVELKPSFLSLILFSPTIKEINLIKLHTTLKNLINIINSQHNSNIKEITIIDGLISIGSKNNVNTKVIAINNGNISRIANNKKIISGEIKIGNNQYNLLSNIEIEKSNYTVNASIKSDSTEGTLVGKGDKDHFQGQLQFKGNNFADFVDDLTETNNSSLLFCNITSTESFVISLNIGLHQGNLSISNMHLNSHNIQAIAGITYKQNEKLDVDFNFIKLDIDKLIGQNVSNSKELTNVLDYLNILIPEHMNSVINIASKEITFRNKVIKDLKFLVRTANGRVVVEEGSLRLPGNNNFLKISGRMKSNNVRTKFEGKIISSGHDFDEICSWLLPVSKKNVTKPTAFSFMSDFYMAPKVFSLANIDLTTDDGNTTGEIRIKHHKKNGTIIGNINISNLNASNYKLKLDNKVNAFKGHENNIPLMWLRNLKYDVDVNFNLSDVLFNAQHMQKVGFVVKATGGRFTIDNLKIFENDQFDIEGTAKIYTSPQSMRPMLNVDIKGNNYNANVMTMPIFLDKLLTPDKKINKLRWSTRNFDFWGIEKFDGNIDILINNIKGYNHKIYNFKLRSTIKDNLITINDFSCNVDKGFVALTGNIGVGSETSLSTVFTLTNLEINSLINSSIGISNISGNFSLNGSIKTQGKNLFDWVNNSSGKLEIAVRGLTANEININSFLNNLFQSKSKSNVAALTQISLYNGDTFFEKIDGSATIKNGILSSLMQFKIFSAIGAISTNLSLTQFITNSLFRFFFIPAQQASTVYIDMGLQGLIWQPKITFNIDELYDIVMKVKESTGSK